MEKRFKTAVKIISGKPGKVLENMINEASKEIEDRGSKVEKINTSFSNGILLAVIIYVTECSTD